MDRLKAALTVKSEWNLKQSREEKHAAHRAVNV